MSSSFAATTSITTTASGNRTIKTTALTLVPLPLECDNNEREHDQSHENRMHIDGH